MGLNPVMCHVGHVPNLYTNCLHNATEFLAQCLAQGKHFIHVSSHHNSPRAVAKRGPRLLTSTSGTPWCPKGAFSSIFGPQGLGYPRSWSSPPFGVRASGLPCSPPPPLFPSSCLRQSRAEEFSASSSYPQPAKKT